MISLRERKFLIGIKMNYGFGFQAPNLPLKELKLFLSSFKSAPCLQAIQNWKVEFLGANGKELSQIFKESFLEVAHAFPPPKGGEQSLPIAVLKFDAGRLKLSEGVHCPLSSQVGSLMLRGEEVEKSGHEERCVNCSKRIFSKAPAKRIL